MNRRQAVVLIGFSALMLLCRVAAPQEPATGDIQVNESTSGNQSHHGVAVQPDGTFVVAWSSEKGASRDYDVLARRFDQDGNALSNEFQVNTPSPALEYNASAAVAPGGEFIVVWASLEPSEIFARRFDKNGNPVGEQFQVNSYSPGRQYRPHVAATAESGFIVVWSGPGVDEESYGIRARRLNSTGHPIGSDIRINSETAGYQTWPRVAAAGDGRFMVTWFGGTTRDTDVRARLFGGESDPLTPEQAVNSYTSGRQAYPDVAPLPDGRWLLAWGSEGSLAGDNFGGSVQARFMSERGLPSGPQFQVNLITEQEQGTPDVAVLGDGRALVVWRSLSREERGWGVRGRILEERSSEFVVNEYTNDVQQGARVGAIGEDGFVVVWRSKGSASGHDADGYSVQLRKFVLPPVGPGKAD